MTVGGASTPEVAFREFCRAPDFQATLAKFEELKAALQLGEDGRCVYHSARGRINISEARTIWRSLDKRSAGSAYKDAKACAGKTVLIIGGGPCGLRMAVETALLGMRTVVVEMRNYVTRNNVLHLWPFVIADLKALGGRVFSNKFCCGSREHASIRSVQQMLLKIALLLGVEVYAPVKYESLIEPDSSRPGSGWRAHLNVLDDSAYNSRDQLQNILNNLEFDVLVGADGKRNTLTDFKRKSFRGKLAIAITANFVNANTPEDNAVEEIGGLFYVFNQPFFDGLRDKAGIELENFVYFKDDTHYFVMTSRKHSLIQKGVLKQDCSDTQQLLSPNNIDRVMLLKYAKETAILSTDGQLVNPEFACDHNGKEDVAIFDFTNLHQAEHACIIKERNGCQLLEIIVGDTLIEPFWPTGSGCARGFLSVFDAAWMMRNLYSGEQSPLEAIAEREAVLQLLSQTKPDNLNMRLTEYTLDPRTRYGPKFGRIKKLREDQVKHLYDQGEGIPISPGPRSPKPPLPPREAAKRIYDGTLNRKRLLGWYKELLTPYSNVVVVSDLTGSWRNGLALLALVQAYRPGTVDVRYVSPDVPVDNNKKAFDLILEHFGIAPTLSPELLASGSTPDRLAILSYLTQLQQQLESEPKPRVPDTVAKKPKKSSLARKFSAAGMLIRLSRRATKRVKIAEPSPRPEKQAKVSKPTRKLERLSRTATLDKCKGIARARIRALQQGLAPDDNVDSRPPSGPPVGVSDDCCICHRRLYVSQRQNARGFFFHRTCFHCTICNTQLWLHTFHDAKDADGQVYFLCPDHAPAEEVEEVEAVPDEEKMEEDVEEMTMEEVAQMLSPDMMSSTMVGVPQGMMGLTMGGISKMAAAFAATAVAEEESEDELTEETEGMGITTHGTPGAAGGTEDHVDSIPRTGSIKRMHYYTLATSMRLLVGHEIQREYEEMETEEADLESKGVAMEQRLKNRQSVIDPNIEESSNEALVEEWMDVVRKKQEVHNKQNKLVIRAKLLELQERHQRLQRQLQKICMLDDLEDDMEALSALTENLSDEVNDTVKQIVELRMFLASPGETEV